MKPSTPPRSSPSASRSQSPTTVSEGGRPSTTGPMTTIPAMRPASRRAHATTVWRPSNGPPGPPALRDPVLDHRPQVVDQLRDRCSPRRGAPDRTGRAPARHRRPGESPSAPGPPSRAQPGRGWPRCRGRGSPPALPHLLAGDRATVDVDLEGRGWTASAQDRDRLLEVVDVAEGQPEQGHVPVANRSPRRRSGIPSAAACRRARRRRRPWRRSCRCRRAGARSGRASAELVVRFDRLGRDAEHRDAQRLDPVAVVAVGAELLGADRREVTRIKGEDEAASRCSRRAGRSCRPCPAARNRGLCRRP